MDKPAQQSPLKPKPDSLGLEFTQDYKPGAYDDRRQWMGGTEVMGIVAHGGKLFASLSYWFDTQPGADPRPGAQVLRKDSADGPWRVDAGFGEQYLRTEAMAPITLTTDAAGNNLDAPVSLLVASPFNFQDRTRNETAVSVRDDDSAAWTPCKIEAMGGVRSFATHADKLTRVDHLFAGTWRGQILRGAYDSGGPGRLRWDPTPELSGTGRVMSIAECGGDLYAACGEKDESPQPGGLFRRIDGPQPEWKQVYCWPYAKTPHGSDEWSIMRGLVAVPDLADGHQVILGTRAWPGVVERVDPKKGHKATVEVDIKTYFAAVFGIPAYTGPALASYNWITPFTHPGTGETVYLIGLWVSHPDPPQPPSNGAFYLVRRADGAYEWGCIHDPAHPFPAGRRMRGARAICVSPFPEDQGRVLYFGGFDAWAGPHHNTAWIYKAVATARRPDQ